MSDKGIIFFAPMVLALIDGRKSQTRRLLRNPEYWGCPTGDCPHDKQAECDAQMADLPAKQSGYAPGQRLYVREAWHVRGRYTDVVEIGFRASQNRSHTEYVEQVPVAKAVPGKGQWPRFPKYGPSIYMPRWASRLTLAVSEVRVERVQSISKEDCYAEGIERPTAPSMGSEVCAIDNARNAYRSLWNSLHTVRGERWQDNPWIVAVTFDVRRGNIDLS
jgi:hypothetical protein